MKNNLKKYYKIYVVMDILKQISNLKKQNESIEKSLNDRHIKFNKLSIDIVIEETELALLKKYNEYLKQIAKENKPVPIPVKVHKIQEISKKNKEEDNNDDVIKDIKPIYSTIVNMEDIKRAFFNKEYTNFNQLVKEQPFKYYKCNFKYYGDYSGRPEYVARNLLHGFIQNLDDYRKHFIVCFRCIQVNKKEKKYRYPSYWIVNSNDDIKNILGDLYNEYDFMLINEEDEINNLLKCMEKTENPHDELIGELYLH